MAEENQTELEGKDQTTESSNTEPQYTEEEQRALQHGWTPKKEWDGPEDEWISAKIFNMRGDFFSRIAKDKREISELRQAVGELVEHSKKTYDEGYKAGLAKLQAERRTAIEEGDTQRAFAIDDEIDNFKEEHSTKKKQFEERISQTKQPDNPIFDQWHANNGWYLTDGAATAYANELTVDAAKSAQQTGVPLDYSKLLQEITRKVTQKFPEKFGGSSKSTKKDVVDSGSRSSSSSSEESIKNTVDASEKSMTDEERQIMNTILKSTKMTKKQYLEDRQKFISRKGG